MTGTSQRTTEQDVLDIFADMADPCEPLSTSEIAEKLDCSHRTAYDKLDALADRDAIETKKIGALARAWWRPSASPESETTKKSAAAPSESTAPLELTHEDVVEVEFESEQLAQPFFELGDEDVSFRIEGFVRLPDGSHTQYWTIQGMSGETVLRLPEYFPTNEDVRLLQTEGDTYRVEVKGAESSLISTYDDFDGESITTVLEDGKIKNKVRFPATVELPDVLEAIRERVAPDFEIGSQKLVYSPRLFKTLVEDELTDRQWTALQMAYYAGYFKVPRQSEGDEIANRMDITRQTLNHHLRHAEETVLSHLFEAPDADDGKHISNE